MMKQDWSFHGQEAEHVEEREREGRQRVYNRGNAKGNKRKAANAWTEFRYSVGAGKRYE